MFGFLLKCDEGEDSRYSCLLSSSTPVSRYREEGREERQGRETGRTFYSLRRQARMETDDLVQPASEGNTEVRQRTELAVSL